jgi:hypothetical protein
VADLGLAEIEFRLARLPPMSRGVHLKGPALYAERLCELWKVDGDVSLGEAFRLLDAGAVEAVRWRTIATDDFADRPTNPRYWSFPSLEELLPPLREQAWQEMPASTLMVEAIKGVRGKRHRVVRPAELPRLTPDWDLARLTLDGRDEFVDVRVRQPAGEPVKKAWRASISETDLRAAAEAIAQACEPGTRLSESEFGTRLKTQTGRHDLTRKAVRTALNDYAPQLKIQPGYRSTKSS